MKLIALVVEKYGDLFDKQILRFSDEYDVKFDFETRILEVVKNKDYLENFYGESIYNITPIVGINGTGKTTILDYLLYYDAPGKLHREGDIKIFEDEENIFIESGVSIKNSSDFFYNLGEIDKKIRIKNCNVLSFGGGGSYVATKVDIDVTPFPNLFESYEELHELGIVKSNMKVILSTNIYQFDEKYPELKNFQGYDRLILYYILENMDKLKEKWIEDDQGEWNDKDVSDLINNKLSYEEYIKRSIRQYNGNHRNFFNNLNNFISSIKNLKKLGLLSDLNGDYTCISNLSYDRKFKRDYHYFYECYSHLRTIGRDFSISIYNDFFNSVSLGMSTGESNLIKIVAHINEFYEKEDVNHWVMIVDEIETGLHLEWSRNLISFIVLFIKSKRATYCNKKISEIWEAYGIDGLSIEDKNKLIDKNFPTFQFIFTTHSPFMLSDIKPGNTIGLKRNDETGFVEVQKMDNTFAKNIQEIMHDDMFISNIYGEFAIEKINNLIEKLKSNDDYSMESDRIKHEIEMIAEPLLRGKLMEMYYKKFNTSATRVDDLIEKIQLETLSGEDIQKLKAIIEQYPPQG